MGQLEVSNHAAFDLWYLIIYCGSKRGTTTLGEAPQSTHLLLRFRIILRLLAGFDRERPLLWLPSTRVPMGWMRCMPHGALAPLGWRRYATAVCCLLLAGAAGHNGTKICEGNPAREALALAAARGLVTARPMPSTISSLVREAWQELDEEAPKMLDLFVKKNIFAYFSHARSTFKEHLMNTFAILSVWGQPEDVRRAGLFHTAFSGDLFQFYVYDAASPAERAELRGSVGEQAESLTWLFGTVHRGSLLGLSDVMNRRIEAAPEMSGDAATQTMASHRLQGEIAVTNRDIAKLIVITLADYLEQMVEVNGWRDHHQVFLPLSLYPGDGKPGVAFHWISAMCFAVRDFLEVVPPIFDRCTKGISYEAEVAARDKYWHVVINESQLLEEEQLSLLEDASALNPFIAEPLLHTAQLHFRNGRHALAMDACARALDRLYAMATAWDKRRSYASWVGFARLLHVRAARMARGLPSLPYNESLPPTSGGLQLVAIEDIAAEMP